MTLKQTLRAIGAIVLEEVERNPNFARRLQLALTTTVSASITNKLDGPEPNKKKNRSRAAAVIDPVATFAEIGRAHV